MLEGVPITQPPFELLDPPKEYAYTTVVPSFTTIDIPVEYMVSLIYSATQDGFVTPLYVIVRGYELNVKLPERQLILGLYVPLICVPA